MSGRRGPKPKLVTKVCYRCGFAWPLSSFHRDKRNPDGRRNMCKDCAVEVSSEWHWDNRERHNARRRVVQLS